MDIFNCFDNKVRYFNYKMDYLLEVTVNDVEVRMKNEKKNWTNIEIYLFYPIYLAKVRVWGWVIDMESDALLHQECIFDYIQMEIENLSERIDESIKDYRKNIMLPEWYRSYQELLRRREKVYLEEVFWLFYEHQITIGRCHKTLVEYRSIYSYLNDELRERYINDIKQEDMERFIVYDLLTREMKMEWFKRVMRFYNQLFDFAVKWNICKVNPMRFIDYERYYPLCHFSFQPEFLKLAQVKEDL